MLEKNPITNQDLSPYQPFGFPILAILISLAVLGLLITAAYELFF